MTGRLIKYQDDTVAYYYNLETGERLHPWNNFSNTFHERSVERNVNAAQLQKIKAQTVEWYIPALLVLLSLFFFAKGAGILSRVAAYLTLERLRVLAGGLMVAVGGAVLFGWIVGIDALIRIIPTANGMNPTTAICFVLLGIALLVVKNSRGSITVALGGVVALTGLLRFIELFGLIGTPIDLILLKDAVLLHEFPARMTQYTALSFVLLGIVPLATSVAWLRRLRLGEVLSSFVFLFSLIALTGYLFSSLEILAIPEFFFAAVHTALLFLIGSALMYAYYRVRDEYALSVRAWLSVSGILLASVLMTVAFASILNVLLTHEARTSFTAEINRATRDIEERIAVYVSVFEGGRGLYSASSEVERDEWKAYVGSIDIQENYPGIQGVGYSVFVTPEEREAHIAAIRSEGFSEYTIKPAGARDLYSAIIFLEPFDERNQQAFGFDMFSNDIRRSAMERARDTGEPRMSGRIILVQEIDEDVQSGFLIYVPVYKNGASVETLEERRENIVGYVYGPFRARNFMEGIIGADGIQDIGLRVEDGAEGGDESVLYDDTARLAGGTPRFSDTRTIYVAGRPWLLSFSSTPTYGVTTFSQVVVPLVVLVGVIVSALMSLMFYTLASSRQRAQAYADQATKDLSEAKAKDEAMLAAIGDGFIATDNEGNIALVNKTFEKLLGWSESEVRGKKLSDAVPMLDGDGNSIPESERLITKALRQNSTTISPTTTLQYKRKDGSVFPVSITVSPIRLEDAVVGAVEVFRDITHEKEIDKAKTEFVSLASHQLRTPLSTINWYAEMLLAGDAGTLSEDQRKFIDEIYTGNQRMVELVNALLNVSRLDLGTFTVEPTPTSVRELVRSVVDEQKPLANKKGVIVSDSVDDSVPVIQADTKLLRMVFQNLLSNSVKYTPEGGSVAIDVKLAKKGENVRSAPVDDDSIVVTVSDTGYGIPRDQHSEIFSKLFRADNVKEKDAEGTGLGLYIVKSIVEHSGGEIWFESEEDEGSTFHIRLPVDGMKKKEGTRTLV